MTSPDFQQFPDAVLTVPSLPLPVAQFLIESKGFRLIPIQFAESLQIHWLDVTRLELIANEPISNEAADRLCQADYESTSGKVFGGKDAVALLQKESTFPLHDGALT